MGFRGRGFETRADIENGSSTRAGGESARGSGDDDSVVPDFSEIEWLGEMNGVIVQKCRRQETCVNLTNNLFQTAKCVSHGQSLR